MQNENAGRAAGFVCPRPIVLAVVGTRPEAIKIAPVVMNARSGAAAFDLEIVATGQHREPATEALGVFGLTPDHLLDCSRPTGDLPELLAVLVTNIAALIGRVRPAAVLVQGDTSSALAGAIAGFYEQVPVVHLEAGLLTSTVETPFPEEAHRRSIAVLAKLHLSPTASAASNLVRRGIERNDVVVTGNTVVDALQHIVSRSDVARPPLIVTGATRRTVVVTAHRRESWGAPMREIARALITLTDRHPDLHIVVVRHPNPAVGEHLATHVAGCQRITCIYPLPYHDFMHLLASASLVLTDSGGLQEELPSMGVHTIVLREETERPEAVLAGCASLAGTDHDRIVATTTAALLRHQSPRLATNPFGDGKAASRVVQAITWMLGLGARPADFAAGVEPSASTVGDGLEELALSLPPTPA